MLKLVNYDRSLKYTNIRLAMKINASRKFLRQINFEIFFAFMFNTLKWPLFYY